MIFGVERKYIIAGAILTVTLVVGGILFWQNNRMGGAAAQISRAFGSGREWVEITPRTGGLAAESTTAAADAKTGKAKTKAEKPVVIWCAPGKAATTSKEIIINEVAWMGGAASYADEWMELKNVSAADVDLNGWQLQNKSQKMKIALEGILPAGGFYLLERTDDTSAEGVGANKIYSGNLGNANEILYLFDGGCAVRDLVSAGKDWPAGDNKTKQTMARTKDLLWRNSKTAGGTPGAEND
ncbi:MAG: lamin tail domain-containing protein [Candidatus Pacebacteria bacterium]|jgi:hypothetical protein|nr:lamin tail domain-containing protein [Candidatus Paceibacterota bacterium]